MSDPTTQTSTQTTTQPTTQTVARSYDRGVLIAAIFVMAAWHSATNLPVSLAGWDQFSPHYAGIALWVGYSALGAFSSWRQLRVGTIGWPTALLICALLDVGVVVNAVTTATGSILDNGSWAFANAGWFALVTLWRRRPSALLLFYVSVWALGAAAQVATGETDRVTAARFVAISYGVAVMQFAVLLGGRSLVRLASQAAEASSALSRVETSRAAAEAVHTARQARYDLVRRTAHDLLAGLSDGSLDPAAPQAQRALRVAVGRLRRLVVETEDVHDPLLHELRALADQAERRGVEVDLQSPAGRLPPVPPEIRRALADPIVQFLASARSHARVTVAAPAAGDLVVAIVDDGTVDLEPVKTPDGMSVSSDVEGGERWAQARWTNL